MCYMHVSFALALIANTKQKKRLVEYRLYANDDMYNKSFEFIII